MTEKIQDVATGAKIRYTTNNIIDDSIATISITDGNLKITKANNTSSSISVPANLKLTTTVSTQKGTSHIDGGQASAASVSYSDSSSTLNAYIGTASTLSIANGISTTYNSGVAKPSSTTLNAQKKSYINITDTYKTVTGLAAGTYTLQNLLQQLVNRSHTHTLDRTMSVSNCKCNCYGDYCSSSSCIIKGNVLTNKGYIPVEELKPGYMIADNNNNYHKLKAIVTGKLENRKAVNFIGNEAIFTSEHLFLVDDEYVTYDIDYCLKTLDKIIGSDIKGTYNRKIKSLIKNNNLVINEEMSDYNTKTYTLIVENSNLCIVNDIIVACAKEEVNYGNT